MGFSPHFYQKVRVSGLEPGACPKFYLVVDSTKAGPRAFAEAKASVADIAEASSSGSESPTGLGRRPRIRLLAFGTELGDAYRMNPVIEIRNLWKAGEIRHGRPGYAHITYDYEGVVQCYDPATGIAWTMANEGHDPLRFTPKNSVPGGHLGGASTGIEEGPVKHPLRMK